MSTTIMLLLISVLNIAIIILVIGLFNFKKKSKLEKEYLQSQITFLGAKLTQLNTRYEKAERKVISLMVSKENRV